PGLHGRFFPDRPQYMRSPAVILLSLIGCSALQAQAPAWTDPPRLVVGIVVDQMRVDHLYRYWDNFGEDGFKRLVREGSFQRDAHYDYMPTFTAPGHASVYTGTPPARHGIVANYPWRRELQRSWYCAKDTTVIPVGTTDPRARSEERRVGKEWRSRWAAYE